MATRNVTQHNVFESSVGQPQNVQHVFHVEWNKNLMSFTGLPDVWQHVIPQSINNVTTSGLPSHISPQLPSPRRSNTIQGCLDAFTVTRRSSTPPAGSSDSNQATPFLKRSSPNNYRSPHLSRCLGTTERVSVREFLRKIGIEDLDAAYPPDYIRDELFLRLNSTLSRLPTSLAKLPHHLQRMVLQWLDHKALVNVGLICSQMHEASLNPELWKALVLKKNQEQGTLCGAGSSWMRSHLWQQSFQAMTKLDKFPKHFDFLWNVLVCGAREVGKSTLVHSLGKSSFQWWDRRKLCDDPVINAVSGIYRIGVDFVIRRVVIGDIVVKLQVWDASHVSEDEHLCISAQIVLLVFDVASRTTFERIPSIIEQANMTIANSNAGFLLVGNLFQESLRDVRHEEAKRFANERGIVYLEVNASSESAVECAFVKLTEEYLALADMKQANRKKTCSIQ